MGWHETAEDACPESGRELHVTGIMWASSQIRDWGRAQLVTNGHAPCTTNGNSVPMRTGRITRLRLCLQSSCVTVFDRSSRDRGPRSRLRVPYSRRLARGLASHDVSELRRVKEGLRR